MDPRIEKIRNDLEKYLGSKPVVFRTCKEREAIDGLTSFVLSNLDRAGKGPKESVMIGRRRGYLRECYIEWYMSRISL